MVKTADACINKIETYINEVAVQKSNSFIDNEFTDQCMISNKFGTSFSTDDYKATLAQWHECLDCHHSKIISNQINGDIFSCLFLLECKHVGEFSGVQATGKTISTLYRCDILMQGKSFSFVSNHTDNTEIIKMLTSPGSADINSAI